MAATGGGFLGNLASHTSHSYVCPMTTFAIPAADVETTLDGIDHLDPRLPRTVANPRRTTWTGYAKDDVDRLPAS